MGIKLRKKESMEHCDSCGATMSEYEYDRYGGLCKLCRGEESKAHSPGGKVYTFTWWDNEPTADRRPTTSADLRNCLHKETFNAADDNEALKKAVEYLCDYSRDNPEDVADTPEEIWDYFDSDWGSGDPIPMVLKQGKRVIKDSGFDPGEDDDESHKAEGARNNEAVTFTAIKNPEQAAFIIDCGSAEKAKALNDAFDDAAHNENGSLTSRNLGGDPINWWNAGRFFAACVDPCDKAAAWCENWLRNSDGA
jgi:hypothetical protein